MVASLDINLIHLALDEPIERRTERRQQKERRRMRVNRLRQSRELIKFIEEQIESLEALEREMVVVRGMRELSGRARHTSDTRESLGD